MPADAARSLERAGADMVLICTNTMHKVAGQVASTVDVPLLYLADTNVDNRNRQVRLSFLG